MEDKFHKIVNFIRGQFPNKDVIPLHEPVFSGNEKRYVLDAIESTFVSSVGAYVDRFEEGIADITGSSFAVAVVNGTSALHLALLVAGVKEDDEVITQSLTFIATLNAIKYIRSTPVFVDVDIDTAGMSPKSLNEFLIRHAEVRSDGFSYNKTTGKRIYACIPMHTFGLPLRIEELAAICAKWNVVLIEDAAESLGSYYKGKHTGITGKVGVFSFNGNKTITAGGGGALITNDEKLAKLAKHLSTQAKVAHRWEFVHDQIGYNYRMPNLNAALVCAQLEQLEDFVANKRRLAQTYHNWFAENGQAFLEEIEGAKSNYWLNAIIFNDINERDHFLQYSNSSGVMTRPAWELMSELPMFEQYHKDELTNSRWLVDRLVNIPSSVR